MIACAFKTYIVIQSSIIFYYAIYYLYTFSCKLQLIYNVIIDRIYIEYESRMIKPHPDTSL